MKSYIEHANITVSDLDRAIEFFAIALPDFEVRKRWVIDDKEWAHVGTDTSYIAINTPTNKKRFAAPKLAKLIDRITGGFNHVGFVVEDVEEVHQRILKAGFSRGYNNGNIIEHPSRRSVYMLDDDGNEFEFMQYLTDDTAERNSYAI
jgi:catechol 2,3-dioxygenase-like lactoylglutathione lyase family enzyme